MGRGPLGADSTGMATGAAVGVSDNWRGTTGGVSGAVWVTVTLELCRALRGSLRVMLTEETVGMATGAGVRTGGARLPKSS